MASSNGGAQPILVAGGGIGGLATAYALARQGCRVRVFEQSEEFREVGAGIQLGPNVFRVLEKIGLKDAILADAHCPAGAGDARRADRQADHPHPARRRILRRASASPMPSPTAPTSTALS